MHCVGSAVEGLGARFRLRALARRVSAFAPVLAAADDRVLRKRAEEMRASAVGMQAAMKRAWVVSVTALAGRRRSA
jgi:hypothetical protein